MLRAFFALLALSATAVAAPIISLNQSDFRDRIHACYLGKQIGQALGQPLKGARSPSNISFYTDPAQPKADLDLQLLSLKALEDHGGQVDARILGQYWLKHLTAGSGEVGLALRNLRLGLLPPLSGHFDNPNHAGNAAWSRAEIWACVAPGQPARAARLAREDACIDHGQGEGTLAAIFIASIESAAFVEPDRDKLIAIGLSMVPDDCAIARAVRAVLAAKQAGKDWKQARLDVLAATEKTGWSQCPRNLGFLIIGWIYGHDDFARSLCTAANCGDAADLTAGTLGSILGIIHGTKSIPEKWRQPIDAKITTSALAGLAPPKDLDELADRTLSMAKKVMTANPFPIAIADVPTDLARLRDLKLADPESARALWELSPYQIVWTESETQVTLDYVSDPIIAPSSRRGVKITVKNLAQRGLGIPVNPASIPSGWIADNFPDEPTILEPGGEYTVEPELIIPAAKPGRYEATFDICASPAFTVPFVFIIPPGK